jgi:hypothetical protein
MLGSGVYNSPMLSLLLQAAQQAKQAAPNVYVTVQQPPPGMSEWAKTLISACVGAIAGIASNSIMEVLKPMIVNSMAKRKVAKQLDSEVKSNLRLFEGTIEEIHAAGSKMSGVAVPAYILKQKLRHIVYDLNFSDNKEIVYEIDPERNLTTFYGIIIRQLPAKVEENNYPEIMELIEVAVRVGREYMATRGLR